MKNVAEDEIKKAAAALLPICRENNIAFIVNDNANLAKSTGADGVHIGEEQDGTVTEARNILGENAVIGVSCYDSKELAFNAGEHSADYVAFGAFYETQTKQPKGHPTLDLLEFWSKYTVIPSVAIGGIKPDNAMPLIKAGADFIAVVTGVWNHPKGSKQAVKEYNDIIMQHSSC